MMTTEDEIKVKLINFSRDTNKVFGFFSSSSKKFFKETKKNQDEINRRKDVDWQKLDDNFMWMDTKTKYLTNF